MTYFRKQPIIKCTLRPGKCIKKLNIFLFFNNYFNNIIEASK